MSSKGIVTAVGPGNASVNIALASGGSVAVSVHVMNPALTLSATNIDFGSQTSGAISASKPLTITNNVRYPLRILAVNSPLNFPQTNDLPVQVTIAAGRFVRNQPEFRSDQSRRRNGNSIDRG